MISETLQTLVTANIADFKNKMSSVTATIDKVEAKSQVAGAKIDGMLSAHGSGTAQSVHKVNGLLAQTAELARRMVRPFSRSNMRGSMEEQAESVARLKQELNSLIEKREEVQAKQAAGIAALQGKHEAELEAIRRQSEAVQALHDKLANLGKSPIALKSISDLQREFARTAKAAEPIRAELDKLMAKYNEASEMMAGLKLYNPEGSAVLEAQQKALDDLEAAMKPYAAQLNEVDVKLEQIAVKMNSLKENPLQSIEGEKLNAQLEATKQKLEALKQKAEETGASLRSAMEAKPTANLDNQISAKMGALETAKKAMNGFAGRLTSFMAMFSKVALIAYAAKVVIGSISKIFNFFKKKREEALEETKRQVKQLAQAMLKVIEPIARTVWHGLQSLGNRIKSGAASLAGRIRNVFRSLLDLGFIRPVMSQIQSLFGSLGDSIAAAERQFAGFGNQMNVLRRNALNLKGAFASMFLPLIQVALPIINQVTAAVTSLFTSIAMFIAQITGQKSVMIAVAGTTQADVAGQTAAAKATKKHREEKERLKQTLASFDQLTILNFGKKDKQQEEEAPEEAGGAGGGGASAGPVFKSIPVTPLKIGNWKKFGRDLAKKINQAILKIDAKAIGTKIGKTLQKAFDFAYGFLNTFKYNRLGNKIAVILNNIFKNLDFLTVGATFAEGFNTIFRMALDFIESFDWRQFGQKISDGLYSFFHTIEWDKLGESFTGGVNGLIDAGTALFENHHAWVEIPKKIGKNFSDSITGIHWKDMGKMMASGFNSAITALREFLGSVKWYDMGFKIFDGLSTAIRNIQWGELGSTLAKGFNSVLDFIHGSIRGFSFKEAAINLMSSINSFLRDIDWPTLGTTLKDLFTGVIDFIQTALDNFKWEDLSKNVNICVKTFLDGADWPDIGKKLNTSFNDALEHFKELMKDLPWKDIGEKVGGFLRGLDWPGIMNTLWGIIKSAFWDMLKSAIGLGGDGWTPPQAGGSIPGMGGGTNPYPSGSIPPRSRAPLSGGMYANWPSQSGRTAPLNIGGMLQSSKGYSNRSSNQYNRRRGASIGMYAQGGVFEPNKPLLGILGDHKSEREIAAPEGTLKQVFKQSLVEMGLSGSRSTGDAFEATIPVQVVVGDEVIEETVTSRMMRRARQFNKPALGGV